MTRDSIGAALLLGGIICLILVGVDATRFPAPVTAGSGLAFIFAGYRLLHRRQ